MTTTTTTTTTALVHRPDFDVADEWPDEADGGGDTDDTATDPLAFARGMHYTLILAIPLWVLILAVGHAACAGCRP